MIVRMLSNWARYSPKMLWQGIFPGHRRACQNPAKIAEIRGNKSTREFRRGNYFPGIIFSGGGDKTITGPLAAAERLTGRLGVKRTPRARVRLPKDQRIFAPHLFQHEALEDLKRRIGSAPPPFGAGAGRRAELGTLERLRKRGEEGRKRACFMAGGRQMWSSDA